MPDLFFFLFFFSPFWAFLFIFCAGNLFEFTYFLFQGAAYLKANFA